MNHYKELKQFCQEHNVFVHATWRNRLANGIRRKIHLGSRPVDPRDLGSCDESWGYDLWNQPIKMTENYPETVQAKADLQAVVDKAKELYSKQFVRAEPAGGPWNCFNVNIFMDE